MAELDYYMRSYFHQSHPHCSLSSGSLRHLRKSFLHRLGQPDLISEAVLLPRDLCDSFNVMVIFVLHCYVPQEKPLLMDFVHLQKETRSSQVLVYSKVASCFPHGQRKLGYQWYNPLLEGKVSIQ